MLHSMTIRLIPKTQLETLCLYVMAPNVNLGSFMHDHRGQKAIFSLLTLVLRRGGGLQQPSQTVFALVQQKGKIAPGIFKFILAKKIRTYHLPRG